MPGPCYQPFEQDLENPVQEATIDQLISSLLPLETAQDSIVKDLHHQHQMMMMNNFIMVGKSYNPKPSGYIGPLEFPAPGTIVKLSPSGELLWKKQISDTNKVLWNVLPLTGGGFITAGFNQNNYGNFTVVRYDDAGEINAVAVINSPESNLATSSLDVCQLNNGNFVFAIRTLCEAYAIITDPSFNELNVITYSSPPSGYYCRILQSVVQISDSTFGINGFSYFTSSNNGRIANSNLIVCDLSGNVLSDLLLTDSVYAETPNFLGVNENGMLSVTASMNGKLTGEGTWVNYWDNSYLQNISGRINLIQYDKSGNFVKREKVYSYPGYGMIQSAGATSDGGFILCGTVNQSVYQTIDGNTKMFLLKIDRNMKEEWSRTINTTFPSFGSDVFETADGGFFIAGHQHSGNNHFNLLAIKTDHKGNF